MSNYYDRPSYDPPKGVCYLTDPRYEEGCNEWQQREYCGVCYNVFMTPRDANGGGVDINACKSDIVKRDQYRSFLQAFDWALSNPISPLACCVDAPFNWLGNACCRYTDDTTIADGYNFATSPIGYYKDNRDKYVRDWCSYRYDNDFITPIGFESRERMEGQIDFMTIYGNWKGAGVSGSIDFGVCDCRGCVTRCLTANNGVATETLDGNTYNLDACEVGMVIPYNEPYSCAWLNMSVNGASQNMARWGGEPYDGGGYCYYCCGSVTCTDVYHCSCCVCYGQGSCQVCCGSVEVCTGQSCIGMINNGSCYEVTGVSSAFCAIIVDFGTAYKAAEWNDGSLYYYVVTAWYDNNAGGMCGAVNFCCGINPAADAIQCSCDVLYSWATQAGKGMCGIVLLGHTAHPICNSIFNADAFGASCFWICAFDPMYNMWNPAKIGAKFYGGSGTPQYCLYDACCWQDVCCTCNYDLYCTCKYDVCCTYQCDVCVCEPLGGSLYIEREPCETDGVLYFGLPNYAIGSIPIKRIKCQVDNTPSYTYMRNDSDSAAQCWSKRDISFAETDNKYKFCFITFPNVCDEWSLDIPKMLSCGVFFYLCSYKCNSGQYINMCKGSVNALTKEVCSAKMLYYTFQGFSVGGAYL